jgi:hypothetical protein
MGCTPRGAAPCEGRLARSTRASINAVLADIRQEELVRTQVVAALVAALNLSALGAASAQNTSPLDKLTGTWKAEPLEIRLNSDFDVSVWGPNASSVRNVELTIRPSGQGTIKETRSVVDAKGKPRPASISIEDGTLQLRPPETVDPNRLEPIVEVQTAKRCYPDDPKDCTTLQGVKVKLVGADLEHDRLYLHFDLPDGRGSFGETLMKQGGKQGGKSKR